MKNNKNNITGYIEGYYGRLLSWENRKLIIKSLNKKVKAKIIAKQDGVIAGLEFCKTAFRLIGRETVFSKKISDGAKIKKNKVIAEIKAYTKTILLAERTALNFLNHASGIATLTNEFTKRISKN